jgi:hypothetical protein
MEAAMFSPVGFSASSTDDLLQLQNIVSSSRLTLNIQPRDENTISTRQTLSKREWEDLKLTIKYLYLDQNKTLKQLAECLYNHHGFKPT